MNLDEEESERDCHHRGVREIEAPQPRSRGWRAEVRYGILEAKVDGIGQNMVQLLKVITRQGHKDREVEGKLVSDLAKGKAPMEEGT